MGDAGAVASRIDEDCHQILATVAERLQIGSGYAGAPRTIRLHHGGVGFAVQGQGHGATRIRDRGAAGDALCHQHFGGVQHIIASNQAHGEGRRGCIDGDGGIQRIAVTCAVSNRNGQGWRAVRQRLQIGRRDADAPVAAAVHGAGIGFTAQGHGHGLPRRGDAGRPRDGLRLTRFCAIQNAIAKRRVQGGVWQAMDKHAQIVAAADRVTGLIDGGDGHGGGAIGQQRQVGGRHGDAPGTVCQRGTGVGFTIERDGHGCPRGQVGTAAVDGEWQQAFGQIQLVVTGNHGNRQAAEVGVDGHVMAGTGRVPGTVADGGGNGGLAVGQQCQIGSRYAGAPGAIGQHGSGVGFAVQGNSDGLARFHMGSGARQGLSGLHLCAVDNVITSKCTDADGRQVGRVGIDVDAVGHAGAVARSIGESGDQVMATVAECLQIGGGQ